MLADTVDFGEYLSGARAPGLIYSASSFGVKCGMGVGSGLCALVLSLGGYAPNAAQGASAISAIRMNFLGIPLLVNVAISLALAFYRLDAMRPDVLAALKARRGELDADIPPAAN